MDSNNDKTDPVKRRSMVTGALIRFLKGRSSKRNNTSNDDKGVKTIIGGLKAYVKDRGEQLYGVWDYLIIVLSLLSVGIIIAQLMGDFDGEVQKLFNLFDNVFCGIFFIDFLVRLITAPSKWSYLKLGWIDLISSIPMLDQLRWGRLLRLMRIVRAIRGAIRGHKKIERRIQDPVISVLIVSLLCIFLGALSVLYLESGVEGANIKTARDAIWWALVTVTTVGYGDFTPVTNEGRLLAVILMSSGIGLFGIFSVQCTQYFLNAQQLNEEHELTSVKTELISLRGELADIKELLHTLAQKDKGKEPSESLDLPSSSSPTSVTIQKKSRQNKRQTKSKKKR